MNRHIKRAKELDTLIRKLYESFALEKISDKRFEMLLSEYESEQAELEVKIKDNEENLQIYENDSSNVRKFLDLAKKHTDFEMLTTPMIYQFIDKIIVHAPYKVNGERVQDIDIHLKFIGNFDFPMPEPTEEELVRLEKSRKDRARRRELYRLKKERKKAEMLETKNINKIKQS